MTDLSSIITRLHNEIGDIDKAAPDKLKTPGASGIVVVGNNMQAIFGMRSGNLMTDMKEYLKTAGDEADLGEGIIHLAAGLKYAAEIRTATGG